MKSTKYVVGLSGGKDSTVLASCSKNASRGRTRDLAEALRDLLELYDRAAGNIKNDSGYTAADVKRLAEIRSLLP